MSWAVAIRKGEIITSRAIPVVAAASGGFDSFWTVFTATEPSGEGSGFSGAGTRKIYVASAAHGGSDSNTGTQASPKLTVAGGITLLRDGKPDWLLFNKGDVWTDQVFSSFTKAGVSASEPMLISSYGTGARPLIKTKSSLGNAFDMFGDYVAVVGLEFYDYTRNPSDPDYNSATVDAALEGFRYVSNFNWVLLEDCKFAFYGNNVTIQATTPSLTSVAKIRRCIIVDSYDRVGHAEGAYIDGVGNLTVDQCVFDHNGWNVTADKTVFNRNLYVKHHSTSGPSTIVNSIFANSSSEGFQARAGGTIADNHCVNNSAGFNIGAATSVEDPNDPIQFVDAHDNVIQHANDITAAQPRGYGALILQAVAGPGGVRFL